MALHSVNGRDYIQLQTSLDQVPAIQDVYSKLHDGSFKTLRGKIDPVRHVAGLLRRSIEPEPPISDTDGGLILRGYNTKLDAYRDALLNSLQWIATLTASERLATGLHNLNFRYNKVFGYFITDTKSNLDKVPEGRYTRKQTHTNAERFITPTLKTKTTHILEAQTSSTALQ